MCADAVGGGGALWDAGGAAAAAERGDADRSAEATPRDVRSTRVLHAALSRHVRPERVQGHARYALFGGRSKPFRCWFI